MGLVRYRGTFGPIGLVGTAAYTESGRVQDSGLAGTTSASGVFTPNATNPKHVRAEDLSTGDFGLVVTYGGLSVGGNFMIGRYNVPAGGGNGGLLAKGQPSSNALIVGASYAIGPVIFGAHYLRSFSMGDQTTATGVNSVGGAVAGLASGGQRFETGAAAGATYTLAPGITLYASYIWEHRRQNGYNFYTGGQNGIVGSTLAAANGVKGVGNTTGRPGLRTGHILRLVTT